MKKIIYWGLGGAIMILLSFTPKVNQDLFELQDPTIEDIVKSYKKAISEWPKPTIDYGVKWNEFSPIKSDSTFFAEQDKPNVILGKTLFLIQNYPNPARSHAALVMILKWAGQTEDM